MVTLSKRYYYPYCIDLQVQGGSLYKPGVHWNARNIDDAKTATRDANLNGVTVMSWWCKEGGDGVAGIAFLGTLCKGDGLNTNINEADDRMAASGYVSSRYSTNYTKFYSKVSFDNDILGCNNRN